MSDLMLIESPNKTKTISKYIGQNDIKILSTYGHVRELDKYGLGFNLESYEIKWKTISKKVKVGRNEVDLIKLINEESDKAERIYLSTDPDREGEGIAWHIFNVLSEKNKSKCSRIVFNEITQGGIDSAFKNPRPLDQNQVDAYLSRRLLDRWIGFKLSTYTYRKIGGISAGRVQSIALKFLKDKKEEIDNFVEESWFQLHTFLENGMELHLKSLSPEFKHFQLKELENGERTLQFLSEAEIQELKESLNNTFELESISKVVVEKRNPPVGLETATMLELSIKKLGINSKTAEKTAQKLYEGIDINDETVGLITYPRTDRNDFSEQFIETAEQFIKKEYSDIYWETPSVKKEKKDQLVQGAHEGIRPTDINIRPEDVQEHLSSMEYRLYEMIWVYTLCSLMKPALFDIQTFVFTNKGNKFKSIVRKQTFDGYKKLMSKYSYQSSAEELDLDITTLIKEKSYDVATSEVATIHTQPPKPYSEASLISTLKKNGIGRPSTYTTIANTVLDRKYAFREDKRILISELGLKVSRDLDENFASFIHCDYTRNMEKELDSISEAKTDWKKFIKTVLNDFDRHLKIAIEKMPKQELEMVEDRKCEKCEGDLIYRYTKLDRKKFISCIRFPKCKYTDSLEPQELLDKNCPDCDCKLVSKTNKRGSTFVGCSGYPDCKYIEPDGAEKMLDEECTQCGKKMVKKISRFGKEFIACSGYPTCKYIKNETQILDEKCPECGLFLSKRRGRYGKDFVTCQKYPECKYIKRSERSESDGAPRESRNSGRFSRKGKPGPSRGKDVKRGADRKPGEGFKSRSRTGSRKSGSGFSRDGDSNPSGYSRNSTRSSESGFKPYSRSSDRKPGGGFSRFGDRKPGYPRDGERKPRSEFGRNGERSFGPRFPRDGERSSEPGFKSHSRSSDRKPGYPRDGERKPRSEFGRNGERSFGSRFPKDGAKSSESGFKSNSRHSDRKPGGGFSRFGDRKPGNSKPFSKFGDRRDRGKPFIKPKKDSSDQTP